VEIFFIDIQELQVSTSSLILDFRCIGFVLVVCVLLSLQMQHHCIQVAFEGGIKGIIVKGISVILWYRVSLMHSIYSPHWGSIQLSI
jgi:hypothetical protein